jgi:hypothetical protein
MLVQGGDSSYIAREIGRTTYDSALPPFRRDFIMFVVSFLENRSDTHPLTKDCRPTEVRVSCRRLLAYGPEIAPIVVTSDNSNSGHFW